MQISKEFPPNFEEVNNILGPLPTSVIFCYGKTIYNPGNNYISPDQLVHEQAHSKEQTKLFMNPEKWWKKYLADPEFRLAQEKMAYEKQWEYALENCNRKYRKTLLPHIIKCLSGPMYNHMISPEEAEEFITQ